MPRTATRPKTGSAAGATKSLSDKRERTRKRILDTAFELIGRENGLNVRIEEVCVASRISRGTFYNYFTSLEQLFEVLAVDLSHDFNIALLSTLAEIESDAERSNAAIQHYLKRARRDPAWGWTMVNLSAAGTIFGAESYEACYVTIDRGIAAGEFDVPNASFGRDLMVGAVLAAMTTTLRHGSAPSLPRLVARHVLRALGVPDARAKELSERPLPEIVIPKK